MLTESDMALQSVQVLVTGGSGMVGRALHSLYGDANFTYLFSRDCNLSDYEATLATMRRIQPTHVIHLAANVGGFSKVCLKR